MHSFSAFQWTFLTASLCGSAVVLYTLYSSRLMSGPHLLSAFRLRALGHAATTLGVVICAVTTLWAFLVSSNAFFNALPSLLLTLSAGLICALFGWVSAQSYVQATRRAFKKSMHINPYMRLKVIQEYIKAFPEDVGVLIPHLCNASSLRLAADLIARNVSVQGEPLVDVMAKCLQDRKNPALIRQALQIGLFRHRKDLEDRLSHLVHEEDWVVWEKILSRHAEMPRVGHILERILEDAITFQRPGIDLELLHRDRLDKAGRTAINALIHRLSDHFAQVGLALNQLGQRSFYTASSSVLAKNQETQWKVVLEPLQSESVAVEWEDYTLVSVQKSSIGALVRAKVNSRANQRVCAKKARAGGVMGTSNYPMLRLRCSLWRGEHLVARVEADSACGIKEVQASRSNAEKRGMKLVQRSALHLERGVLSGAGLRVLYARDTYGAELPSTERYSRDVSQESQHSPLGFAHTSHGVPHRTPAHANPLKRDV